jgi:hypothetical protein
MTNPVILSEAKDLAPAKESFGRSGRSFAPLRVCDFLVVRAM